MTRVARHTLRQYAIDGTRYVPSYKPSSLDGLAAGCVVTVRLGGRSLGGGASASGPVRDACNEAAYAAAVQVASMRPFDVALVEKILIGVELIGESIDMPMPVEFINPDQLEGLVEPGVDGVAITLGHVTKQFLPSEIIQNNIRASDALWSLAEQLSTSPAAMAGAKAQRFRTCEWYEQSPGGSVVELRRGMVLIVPQSVTARALTTAAQRLADHMVSRKRFDDLFAYQYEPSMGIYSDEDSLLAQAGATWALSAYSRGADGAVVRQTATAALDRFAERVTELDDLSGVSCVVSPDGENDAGLSALSCLAMIDHPDRGSWVGPRDRLIAGLLWLQQDDGRFLTAFPPARRLPSQTDTPGLALLALARAYELNPGANILASFDKALPYYRRMFSNDPDPAFCIWQMQAFAVMAGHTRRRDYAEFTFDMADRVVQYQMDEQNCAYPELWGGMATRQTGRAGVSTAGYVEGLADALRLARRVKDGRRVATYERAVRLGIRFVLQLQVRPDEIYYSVTPSEAVWGVRSTPTTNYLRIDHSQHALMALMKARQVLFDDEAPAAGG